MLATSKPFPGQFETHDRVHQLGVMIMACSFRILEHAVGKMEEAELASSS